MSEYRVGNGFDVHAFAENRKLVIGGVKIDFPLGLAGHSDADVLTHAIIDALLGAAGLGDIGRHFPDTDDKYKDIDSLLLLKDVRDKLKAEGWQIGNIDATVIAQKPKLAGYIERIEKTLAECLAVDISKINVKATTTERLGFTGREEGIAALASTALYK
ncbi:MAG: 2-C-methyl-D-erythritol 2,4-cyclodiphosphate synthase [candidate division Zixibacteria bacterium]|nr:2-C-methyl-D-erythritol 2,4-cyclodiphosphate synthase [candidate division Zixibacteria bacterium]